MSLQLVLGNSGAGKSHYLFTHIIEKAGRHPEKKYLIVVPEQFTMQTQKELVRLSPQKALLNIDIVSFQRLALRIFAEVGGKMPPILEEVGKTLVVQRMIQENEKKLGVLLQSLRKRGTVSEMKSLISELMQYEIRPEQLDEMIEKSIDQPLLVHKLYDIRTIYEGFLSYLEDRYITSEEILDVLCEKISESKMMQNCEVVLDGFTGFTPVQNKLMRKLLQLAQRVWVTITLDQKCEGEKWKSPQHLFHMSGKMLDTLLTLAREEHVPIDEEIWMTPGENTRLAHAPALHFLEQHLFRYPSVSYTGDPDAIHIFAANNPRQEMEIIVNEIQRLVRTRGYRYGEFGIITGDLSVYGTYARQIFAESRIPCFLDEKHSIMMNPFVEYLRAALNMVSEHFSYESVFRYLRCGLSGLNLYEIDSLENYCIALGIRGWKQWNTHWIRRYRGMSEEGVEQIDGIRRKFISQVEEFAQKISGRDLTVEERTRILYEFVCRGEIAQRLKEKEEFFLSKGEMALAKEYEQIYEIIIKLLDKMVLVLGDEKISLADYIQILEAGFQELQVGVIPPSADQVLVGDMERTRLKDIRVLFFAGVNDHVIPKRAQNVGLLSESDREFLDEMDVELAPTARASMYIQKFYLYLNLTKPSQRLYLSYAKTSGQGQAQGPAYLISMICRMFPKLSVQDIQESSIWQTQLPSHASQILLAGFPSHGSDAPSREWMELYQWFAHAPEWKEACRGWLDSAFLTKPQDRIGKSVAHALYGTVLENSVSRLERFAACAFAHFLQYGLELEERQEYEFRAADLGNVMHLALEEFSKMLRKHRLNWRDLSQEERENLIDESVESMIHDYGNTIFESSARNRYIIARVKRILRRTVWAIQEQIRQGKYEPGKFEISFSMEEELDSISFALSKEERMRLKGRIDRVDRCEDGDTIYIKVIDYKTGNTSLDLIALYHGLQLQLVVYMNAAMEVEQREHPDKVVEPAGMFYYHIKDPLADGELGESEESVRMKILQELKVNGLVRSEEKILLDMDASLGAGVKSMVIPVAFQKNGALTKHSQTATKEQFTALCAYVNGKIQENGRKILDGVTDINPYQMKKQTACDYCPYREVCGFDTKIPGYEFRRLPVFEDGEIWKKIQEKEDV